MAGREFCSVGAGWELPKPGSYRNRSAPHFLKCILLSLPFSVKLCPSKHTPAAPWYLWKSGTVKKQGRSCTRCLLVLLLTQTGAANPSKSLHPSGLKVQPPKNSSGVCNSRLPIQYKILCPQTSCVGWKPTSPALTYTSSSSHFVPSHSKVFTPLWTAKMSEENPGINDNSECSSLFEIFF